MGNFTFNETKIKDVYIIDVKTYGDNRGYFMETYKESDFKEAGLDYNFLQDNQSSSRKGVLRGLHFQKTHPQAKLVRVLKGEVWNCQEMCSQKIPKILDRQESGDTMSRLS